MSPKSRLEPQQERSRESLRKLQKATAEVLGQHGVDGATIPRIARHAGLTPGAVYRRFRDKDALLETTILGILERQEERLRGGITPDKVAQIPLPVFAEQVISGMVITYRANAALLRAMRIFTLSKTGTPFWKKACQLETRSYERVVNLFLAHRDRMRHAEPRTAIAMGLMMVISTLFEVVVFTPEPGPWKSLLPKDDRGLHRELTRAFLNYLGAEQKEK